MAAAISQQSRAGVLFALCAGLLLTLGLGTRLGGLSEAPLHFDESTGARQVGWLLDGEGYRFDPGHFHGPLPIHVAGALALGRGESGWRELEKLTLRLGPALAGVGSLALCLGLAPVVGRLPAVLGALLLALSPYVTFYQRLFIHEPFLVFWGLACLCAGGYWLRRPTVWRELAVGLCAGAMLATRETGALFLLSWLVLGWPLIAARQRAPVLARAFAVALPSALLVVTAGYSNGFTDPGGPLRFALTFVEYETTPGHEKPWGYYWSLLFAPHSHGRLIWWDGVSLLPAFVAAAVCGAQWLRRPRAVRAPLPLARALPLFLLLSGVLQLAAFSFIAYKTPWLALLPWAQILAGSGMLVGCCWPRRWSVRAAQVSALAGLLVFQVNCQLQTRQFASDPRNPYAYVPTAPDVERWCGRVVALVQLGHASAPVAVAGSAYWPIPWYLRALDMVGYWPELPTGAAEFPVVVCMPECMERGIELLGRTHRQLPHGLRGDTPVLVFIRNDLWPQYIR